MKTVGYLVRLSILTALLGSATASAAQRPSASCSVELQDCKGAHGACVSLRFPDKGATCNSKCQLRAMRALQRAGATVLYDPNMPSSAEPKGCVGFRQDLGGNARGAHCLAKALGYKFDGESCNKDGWPYTVVVP